MVTALATLVAGCGGSVASSADTAATSDAGAEDAGEWDAGPESESGVQMAACPDAGAVPLVSVSQLVGLVANDTSVFWSDGQTVFSIPADGGTPTAMFSGFVFGVALDSTNLYWTSCPAPGCHATDVRVWEAPFDGGTPTQLAPGAETSNDWSLYPEAWSMAAADGRLCWSTTWTFMATYRTLLVAGVDGGSTMSCRATVPRARFNDMGSLPITRARGGAMGNMELS